DEAESEYISNYLMADVANNSEHSDGNSSMKGISNKILNGIAYNEDLIFSDGLTKKYEVNVENLDQRKVDLR
ncbi:MAG: hypothetical protein MHPSP_004348, partial [Paramarteilia canceri]